MAGEAETYTIAGREVAVGGTSGNRITPPSNPAAAIDVAGLAARNGFRAAAAAIGLCWRGPGRPKASYRGHGYDPGSYAGAIIDELIDRGASLAEIVALGKAALALCNDILPREPEVEAAENFSEAPGEG